ncbi:putative oxidoreductase [Nostocoides japonicum T1-X7]|uniref:Putative oxidoreductase n=1 Tax=Nostocoides japonicum T1-X7 TaxID=1194083 RepID=A0A077LV87_9MICO|nr:NAD-dependent epimerase/dehydratase family protein [Tetrasphaera japonica]CCH77606.1 putative oxidoreductase [Tetrasphaera japonica T1-X7]
MDVLVLGGTAWLGGEVARRGVSLGHTVTCLARGESGPVPEGARLVVGDRSTTEAYAELEGRRFDLVVDVARQPLHVRTALDALGEHADHWVLVSTGSVYADHASMHRTEATSLLPAFEGDEAPPELYGEAKVACEQACRAVRGDDVLIARSGLIAGAGDPSDRAGYWPGRFALAAEDGGPVLVPERRDVPCQLTDVRDLAGWLLEAGLAAEVGTMNAVAPERRLEEVLDAAAAVAGFAGERVPMSDDALREAGVEEYMGPRSLPLWIADPEWAGFQSLDDTLARDAGLTARPVEDTLAAALAWERELGLARTGRRAGLDRDDELALLGVSRD